MKLNQYINTVFSNIAKDYDLMNNVISFGSHKFIKRKAIKLLNLDDNDLVLDLAGGTGDMGILVLEESKSNVIIADRNQEMLEIAKEKIIDANLILCDAENLPFKDNSINKVVIGFGIRNFPNLDLVLEKIFRVLKNNGKLVIVEFAQPPNKIFRIFRNVYFRKIIPFVSKILIRKKQEYHYLATSIINFPEQKRIIDKLKKAEFKNCQYINYFFGNIAIYSCNK